MLALSCRERKLLVYWTVITLTSVLFNAFTQGPPLDCSQYTDDPCTTTCIGCDWFEPTNIWVERCCCRPDWGCLHFHLPQG